jgi:hypothetical protein
MNCSSTLPHRRPGGASETTFFSVSPSPAPSYPFVQPSGSWAAQLGFPQQQSGPYRCSGWHLVVNLDEGFFWGGSGKRRLAALSVLTFKSGFSSALPTSPAGAKKPTWVALHTGYPIIFNSALKLRCCINHRHDASSCVAILHRSSMPRCCKEGRRG